MDSDKLIKVLKTYIDGADSEKGFWEYVKSNDYPIIDKVDEEKSIVSLLFHGNGFTENVIVLGPAMGFDYMTNGMSKYKNTNIWHISFEIDNDVEVVYNYSVNDLLDHDPVKRHLNKSLDPLNDKIFRLKDDPDKPSGYDLELSYFKMINTKEKVWSDFELTGDQGILKKWHFDSGILGNSRRLWLYMPSGIETDPKSCNLLIFNDGNNYINWFNTVNVLNKQISDKKIPPSIGIFIDSTSDRMTELVFNDLYTDFILSEVIPFLEKEEEIEFTKKPSKRVLVGFSLGGLASCYMALKNSHEFGNVLCQSGSLFWENNGEPEWLIKEYENSSKLPVKFFISYGKLEGKSPKKPTIVDSSKKFAELLNSMNYDVKETMFSSGHDYLNWGESCAEGLLYLSDKIL